VISLAGTDQSAEQVEIPEIWSGGSWGQLAGAGRALPYYPRSFVAPNGLLFYAGELQQSAYLDPAGAGRWIPVASSNYGRRDYGSAVMYQPGKVMIVGGSDPPDGVPTNTAELIDLNQPQPSWHHTESMRYPRRQFNATLLPDGEILATGGTSAPGFSNPAGAVHAAELWSPATGRWRELASNRTTRVYHSTTLLLPDGRVLHAGSGDGPGLPRELSAEIFSPPYLFRGTRPQLQQAPARAGYGESFLVSSLDALNIVRVTLVRLGSVTHAFDQSQRFLELSFRRVPGGLSVKAPSSGAMAPPGPYLLTLLEDAGIPSTSALILIH
jgi:galactose oxidase